MIAVAIADARENFLELVSRAQSGEEVVIERGSRRVARIVPFTKKKPQRQPGLARGQIRVSKNFDAPLPDRLVRSFYK